MYVCSQVYTHVVLVVKVRTDTDYYIRTYRHRSDNTAHIHRYVCRYVLYLLCTMRLGGWSEQGATVQPKGFTAGTIHIRIRTCTYIGSYVY